MCSESGAYGDHDEYMMSHYDYEQDMDDYYHNMDLHNDYDASCMEDMEDHRYYEHDMVDHHYYDHDVELYTDYTSTSIIEMVEHHTNYDTDFDYDMEHVPDIYSTSMEHMMEHRYDDFSSTSISDMNHYYNYDTASLDDMMEPYYTDYSYTFDSEQEAMNYAPTMFTTKPVGPTYRLSCSRRSNKKKIVTSSSYQAPSTSRRCHEKDIDKATSRHGPSRSRRRHKKNTKMATTYTKLEDDIDTLAKLRYISSSSSHKRKSPRHPNDLRRHPSHQERQRRKEKSSHRSKRHQASPPTLQVRDDSSKLKMATSAHHEVSPSCATTTLAPTRATNLHDELAKLKANIDKIFKHRSCSNKDTHTSH